MKRFVPLGLIAGVLLVISLLIGRYSLSVTSILTGFPGDELGKSVFLNLRLPRTMLAAYAGFVLAIVGSTTQTIFKNPLASPDVYGVSGGASVGAAVGVLFFSNSIVSVTLTAFVGGLLAVALVILLTRRNSRQLATFVVIGLAINALTQSVLMLLKRMADPTNELAAIDYWMMGGLNAITFSKMAGVIGMTVIPLVLLLLLQRQCELLSLSDMEAASLGVHLSLIRPLLLILTTLAVSGIVASTGLISFVGVIAPHLARLLTRRNDRQTFLLSGIIGVNLLLTADLLARTLTYSELPISVLTSAIGVPVLIHLVLKEKRLV